MIVVNCVAFKKQRLFVAGRLWRLSNKFPILPLDCRPTLCFTKWVIFWSLSPCTRGLGEVGSSGPVQPGQLLQSLSSTNQITKTKEVHYSFSWGMLPSLGNLSPFSYLLSMFIFVEPVQCFPNLHWNHGNTPEVEDSWVCAFTIVIFW